jgi:esterase/lipase superfamily enzyme
MPTAAKVDQHSSDLPKPFLVAGCRGLTTAANREPTFDVRSTFRFVKGALAELQNRETIVFVHGYNVTPSEGLRSAREFFSRLHTEFEIDGVDTSNIDYLLFTWPGDTGTIYFNEAQAFAQYSGVALYELLSQCKASRLTLVTHSLGAHVGLRALAVLGEHFFHRKSPTRVDETLLLAAAVEDDVFERPQRQDEYHFPESAFGTRRLHITASRSDDVLSGPFRVNECDAALGYSGPETMGTLASLTRRVEAISAGVETFKFELHDFSPRSATILNPALHVQSHGGYWTNAEQLNYYAGLLRRPGG